MLGILIISSLGLTLAVTCRQCIDTSGKLCNTGECTGDYCLLTYDDFRTNIFVKRGCVSSNTSYSQSVDAQLSCNLVMDLDTIYSAACVCASDNCMDGVILPATITPSAPAVTCHKGHPSNPTETCQGSACFYSKLSLGCIGNSPITALQTLLQTSTDKQTDACTTVNGVEQCACNGEKCNAAKPTPEKIAQEEIECYKCMGDDISKCTKCQGSACVVKYYGMQTFMNERYCVQSTTTLDAICTTVALQAPEKTYTTCTCKTANCNVDISSAQPFVKGSLEADYSRKDAPLNGSDPEKPLNDDGDVTLSSQLQVTSAVSQSGTVSSASQLQNNGGKDDISEGPDSSEQTTTATDTNDTPGSQEMVSTDSQPMASTDGQSESTATDSQTEPNQADTTKPNVETTEAQPTTPGAEPAVEDKTDAQTSAAEAIDTTPNSEPKTTAELVVTTPGETTPGIGIEQPINDQDSTDQSDITTQKMGTEGGTPEPTSETTQTEMAPVENPGTPKPPDSTEDPAPSGATVIVQTPKSESTGATGENGTTGKTQDLILNDGSPEKTDGRTQIQTEPQTTTKKPIRTARQWRDYFNKNHEKETKPDGYIVSFVLLLLFSVS